MTKANLNKIIDEVTLPEYIGTTDGDRANYLLENADVLADQAVAAAREKIGGRNLAVEADAYANQRALERANQLITDPDSVMNATRPECNDTTSKENAKRVGQEILALDTYTIFYPTAKEALKASLRGA
jgi:hypothetical protein